MGQTVAVDEPEYDERKVRIGLMLIGAVIAISIALFIVVDDPIGRFIFGFVAIVSAVQLWRLRRGARR
jgi:hypothetical protein